MNITKIPSKPSMSEASSFLEELVKTDLFFHLDDDPAECLGEAGAPAEVLSTIVHNHEAMWDTFTSDEVWEQIFSEKIQKQLNLNT